MEIHDLQGAQAPGWVRRLMDKPRSQRSWAADGLSGRTLEAERFSLTQVDVPGARALDAATFQMRVKQAYKAALEALAACRASHAVRWWNYVPGIGRDAGEGMDWYMVFNAGRHEAMRQWIGTPHFDRQLATASGVGSHGDDFVMYVLGATRPGHPVENPRQIPAYRYSSHFGPLPPCFARATGLECPEHPELNRAVLIGGTASIVGETTRHIDDLDGQLDETLRNMTHLLGAACGRPSADERVLESIDEVRVYVVRPPDRPRIVNELAARLPGLERMEVVHADLCRPPLLVELEGRTRAGVLASADPIAATQRLTVV